MAAVDHDALRKLMADVGGEPDTVRELLDTFMAEVPRVVGEMRAALERSDRRTLNRCAHTLKSTAATFGARELSRLCRELEEATMREIGPDVRAGVVAAEAEWARVQADIAAWKL